MGDAVRSSRVGLGQTSFHPSDLDAVVGAVTISDHDAAQAAGLVGVFVDELDDVGGGDDDTSDEGRDGVGSDILDGDMTLRPGGHGRSVVDR